MADTGLLPAVRSVEMTAPFRWLAEGLGDFSRAPMACLFYGVVLAAVSFVLSYAVITSNGAFWALALTVGFVFIAPMLAMGLYEAGRVIEKGGKPSLSQMLFVRGAVRQDVAYLGLLLVLIYLFWGRIAQIVYGLSTFQLHRTVSDFLAFALGSEEGRTMLFAGSLVGGVIAFVTYALVVVAAPMLLDRDANIFAAAATSLKSVATNFGPLLLWAVIIAVLVLLSAATGFLAFVVVFPWLGLASWRAYRDLVKDAAPA